ncbi:hypothetical protein Tco_1301280 [Tanacetum coccineum]
MLQIVEAERHLEIGIVINNKVPQCNKVPQEIILNAMAEKVKELMLAGVKDALGLPTSSLHKPIYSRVRLCQIMKNNMLKVIEVKEFAHLSQVLKSLAELLKHPVVWTNLKDVVAAMESNTFQSEISKLKHYQPLVFNRHNGTRQVLALLRSHTSDPQYLLQVINKWDEPD